MWARAEGIPSDWGTSRLGDLAQVTVGYVGPTNPYYTSADTGVLFLRTGNITESGISTHDVRWVQEGFHRSQPKSALHAGDVVVSRVGYTGTAAVVPELGPVNCANMIIIRPNAGLEAEWVRRLFSAEVYLRQVNGFTAGSAQPVLNIKLVQRLETPIPAPAEQRQIAEVLDTVDEAIRRTEQIIAKLKQLKQGLLRDLLTRGIDDNGELRNPDRHPEQFKDSRLGRIPMGWDVTALGNLAAFVTSGSRGWARFYADDGALFVRSQNVRMGSFDFTDRQHVSLPPGAEGQRTRLEPHDLLITITGNSVGNVACLPRPWQQEAFISQHVGLVRLHDSEIGPFAMHYLVEGSPGNRQLLDAQYGQSKPGLNLMNLRELLLPLPSADEREAIISGLQNADERIEREDGNVAVLRQLKSGLMEDLLTGRIRVTRLLEDAAE